MDRENNEVSIDINKVGGSPLPSIAAVNTTRTEMYKAARKGDWKAAEVLLRKDRNLAHAEITSSGDRALHVAAASEHTEFVRELVKLMSENELLLRNKQGRTAFCYAAESGIVEIADVMRRKNPSLVTERDEDLKTPLYNAAFFGKKNMAMYLFNFTREEDLPREEWFDLLIATIRSRTFDVALRILNRNGSLAKMSNEKGTALHHLAQPVFVPTNTGKKTTSNNLFPGEIDRKSQDKAALLLAGKLWAVIQTLGQDVVTELIEKPFSILHEAAKRGNLKLIDMIVRSDPHLLLRVDKDKRTILQTAVLYRQAKVFDLIREMGYLKRMLTTSVDKDENNILHLAAILTPLSCLKEAYGAAFQMKSEMLWYKEVKGKVPYSYRKMKNKDGLIPREVFSKEHQGLFAKGEKWMRQTSNSWMLIATIIATVAFSAAITLPGGNDDKTGMPLLLKSRWFIVFLVSDVVAMLCATISMLTFLFIATSPYSEGHFIKRTPESLRVAMVTLQWAVVAMLVAFTSAFYLAVHKEHFWIPRYVIAFTFLALIYAHGSKLSLFAYSGGKWMFSTRPSNIERSRRARMFSLPRLTWRKKSQSKFSLD